MVVRIRFQSVSRRTSWWTSRTRTSNPGRTSGSTVHEVTRRSEQRKEGDHLPSHRVTPQTFRRPSPYRPSYQPKTKGNQIRRSEPAPKTFYGGSRPSLYSTSFPPSGRSLRKNSGYSFPSCLSPSSIPHPTPIFSAIYLPPLPPPSAPLRPLPLRPRRQN